MSEDEVEKFEITDYDLENEFSMYKNRRGPTKHQQIYGEIYKYEKILANMY